MRAKVQSTLKRVNALGSICKMHQAYSSFYPTTINVFQEKGAIRHDTEKHCLINAPTKEVIKYFSPVSTA